ncbi:HlyD family efflux transporter periplasmic adaptor subunit [Erysipelothrix sp. HDW6B]|uniref:HlyD family efflux transporter periplasmic adaptor subunit n=1 Tax=Erysipelothrix sp. HDW6B TaxID=2714929 RepID=UPI0014085E2D|nr:HlyD family efflux transporter periplasmic adaptor subunit [Erysipelothrix sp. HDW6B]QIK86251.1 HlyD family efflux transporter periplasmic adaptor subunit [Erysipelothrix sp. HDW6B]
MSTKKQKRALNSRIQLMQTPKGMTIFLLIILSVIVSSGYIAAVTVQPTKVLSTQGYITTSNRQILSVNNPLKVKSIHYKNGDYVEKGVKILEGDASSHINNVELIEEQLRNLDKRHEAVNQFITSLQQKYNHLSQSGYQLEYYGKVAYFLNTIKQEKDQKQVIKDKIDLKKIQLSTMASNTLEEKEQIQNEVEALQQQSESFTQADSLYYQLLSESGHAKTQIMNETEGLNLKRNALEKEMDQQSIKAPENGIIHLYQPITVGTEFQAQQMFGEIIDGTNTESFIETFVESQNRSKISEKQQIKFSIIGNRQLNRELIKGSVTSIEESPTMTTQDGNTSYRYKVRIQSNKLEDLISKHHVTTAVEPLLIHFLEKDETYMDIFLKAINVKG